MPHSRCEYVYANCTDPGEGICGSNQRLMVIRLPEAQVGTTGRVIACKHHLPAMLKLWPQWREVGELTLEDTSVA